MLRNRAKCKTSEVTSASYDAIFCIVPIIKDNFIMYFYHFLTVVEIHPNFKNSLKVQQFFDSTGRNIDDLPNGPISAEWTHQKCMRFKPKNTSRMKNKLDILGNSRKRIYSRFLARIFPCWRRLPIKMKIKHVYDPRPSAILIFNAFSFDPRRENREK